MPLTDAEREHPVGIDWSSLVQGFQEPLVVSFQKPLVEYTKSAKDSGAGSGEAKASKKRIAEKQKKIKQMAADQAAHEEVVRIEQIRRGRKVQIVVRPSTII